MSLVDKYIKEVMNPSIEVFKPKEKTHYNDKKKIDQIMKELEKVARKMGKVKFEDDFFKFETKAAVDHIWTAIKALKDAK